MSSDRRRCCCCCLERGWVGHGKSRASLGFFRDHRKIWTDEVGPGCTVWLANYNRAGSYWFKHCSSWLKLVTICRHYSSMGCFSHWSILRHWFTTRRITAQCSKCWGHTDWNFWALTGQRLPPAPEHAKGFVPTAYHVNSSHLGFGVRPTYCTKLTHCSHSNGESWSSSHNSQTSPPNIQHPKPARRTAGGRPELPTAIRGPPDWGKSSLLGIDKRTAQVASRCNGLGWSL